MPPRRWRGPVQERDQAFLARSTFQLDLRVYGALTRLAGLRIEESDKDGLRLRAYRPFPPARVAKERDLGSEGTQTPESKETPPARDRTIGEAA